MTDTTAGEGVKALLDHMKLMQRTAMAYLVPEDYRDRSGNVVYQGTEHNSPAYKIEQRGRRAEAFANDMLYLLDGPEQRAAESLAAQPSAGAQGEDAELEADMERDLTESDLEAIERSLRTILAFNAVGNLRSVLSDTMTRQASGYDWNADPDGMTLRQSEAIKQADRVAIATPAQPDTGDVAALREARRLALEDAVALERCAEEADDNQWQDWGATMRQSAERIRILAALSKPNAQGREG